jgi:hypothetical protein
MPALPSGIRTPGKHERKEERQTSIAIGFAGRIEFSVNVAEYKLVRLPARDLLKRLIEESHCDVSRLV